MLTANHAALANELHMQRLRRNIALLSAKELIHENMFSCEKSQPRANHPTYSNKYMVGRFSYGQETPPGLLPQAHSCMVHSYSFRTTICKHKGSFHLLCVKVAMASGIALL